MFPPFLSYKYTMIPITENKTDLYNFKFPVNFIPNEIIKKYEIYLNRIPGNIIQNVKDFVNYSIQGISIPGLSAPELTQQFYGVDFVQRGKDRVQNAIDKQFTITFGSLSGYLNYWILYETFLWYYSSEATDDRNIPIMKLQLTDGRGNHIITIEMHNIVWTELSGLDFNMANNVIDFDTFTATFRYSLHNIKLEFDERT